MSSLWVICVPLPVDHPTCKIKNCWHAVKAHFGTRSRSYRKDLCLEWRPIVRLWVNVAAQPLPFPRCKARSCWDSVDAHFQDIVVMMSQPFPRRKVADSSMIVQCRHTAFALSMMQGQKLLRLRWRSYSEHSPDVVATMVCLERWATVRLWVKDVAKPSEFPMMQCQKLLTLRWRSFLGGSSVTVCCAFTYKGCHNYDYGSMPLHIPAMIQDVRPEIVDAPLTLVSMTGQSACRLLFSLRSRPILLLGMDATMQAGDCWIDMTINYWCSVDAHLWGYLRDLLTVIGCTTIVQNMHTASIGSKYTVSM